MRKRNKLLVSMFAIILVVIIIGIRNFSFSQLNVYPRKKIQQYLQETYYGEFTYIKQEYLENSRYHIWIVYFKDGEEREFAEYFYMRNSRDTFFASYKEYGRIWDTYASIYLEEKFAWLIENRCLDDEREKLPESHYIFKINEGEEGVFVTEELVNLYKELLVMLKKSPEISLNCEVQKEDKYSAIFYASTIYDKFNQSDESSIEQELRAYFEHALVETVQEEK